jgi:6-phosphogluconate dehydrogenase
MQLGMIGLGRMGGNMVRRLLRAGHECVVFDLNEENVREVAAAGAVGVGSMDEFVAALAAPRAAWIMVPAGEPTEKTIRDLAERMHPGDVSIDGGNTFFKDDVRRAGELRAKQIHYVDVGTSGGVWGLESGYCLMIGGEPEVVQHLDPVLRSLAPGRSEVPPTPDRRKNGTAELGYVHCGPVGSGHFAKMVHNGIEYGLMQAYAEGFDILRGAGSGQLPEEQRYEFDLADLAEVWRHGSVVRSWLLDLTAIALAEDAALAAYEGYVQDSGEGRWTVQTAIEEAVPAHVLSAALYARFRSRQQPSFADKLLSAMRKQFGGHAETKTR